MSREGRIARRFAALRQQGRGGLITFVTAGDPEPGISAELLARLPAAGADLVELGMPFTDPMADGPAIQASSLRALKAGQTMARTLKMVGDFRRGDAETPLVLMGYYNPVFRYGVERFAHDARQAGVDGLILVDLPPEEADEVLAPAEAAGLDFIFLAAPTTTRERLPRVVARARGFIYYVSITGVTGTRSATTADVAAAVARIRAATPLPVAVGFGINSPERAAAMARLADAAVVGSAVVRRITEHLDAAGRPQPGLVDAVCRFVGSLAEAVRAGDGAEVRP